MGEKCITKEEGAFARTKDEFCDEYFLSFDAVKRWWFFEQYFFFFFVPRRTRMDASKYEHE